jgi:hypothetical protein
MALPEMVAAGSEVITVADVMPNASGFRNAYDIVLPF